MHQILFGAQSHLSKIERLPPKADFHFYEEDFPQIDFILFPYIYLLGKKSVGQEFHMDEKQMINRLFSKNHKEDIHEQFKLFLQKETPLFKKNSQMKTLVGNTFSYDELYGLVIKGIREFIIIHKKPNSVRKKFRSQLPASTPALHFSLIARFINNGYHDEFWYEKIATEIERLFPHFEPKLIKSLLSITSIKANLPSNIKKFFKVLHLFYLEKKVPVRIGQKGKEEIIETFFPGLLWAQMKHLQSLKDGVPLIASSQKNKRGRKIKNFADAMDGDAVSIIADVWITRAFDCDVKRFFGGKWISTSPSKAVYDAIEWYLQTIGELANKDPCGVCAMIWSGIRSEKTKQDTEYTYFLKMRLSHGLFHDQFGDLMVMEVGRGIGFQEKPLK